MPTAIEAATNEVLWEDLDVLAVRHERSAQYLEAIRELVAGEKFGGPAGEDFLRACDFLAAADPAEFTAVWTDPAAYLWVRTAYQLLGAHFGSLPLSPAAATYQSFYRAPTPAAAAQRHLEQFQLFPAGLAMRTYDDWTLALPLELSSPVAIPGTRTFLTGNRPVTLQGVRAGLPVSDASAEAWQECPVLRGGDCELRLQAPLFQLPGIGYGGPLQEAGTEYQRTHTPRLEQVLTAIERYAPQALKQIASHIQGLALKPAHLGDYSNVSHSELPGASILSLLDDPVIMADRLIHELHHHRLFCLEEQGGALLDDRRQDSLRDARFYSPWRDDPRPLHGLLHAFYVFQPVWHFWSCVRRLELESSATLAFADDQLRRIPRQLELAAGTLRTYGAFTDYGQAVFDGICRGADEIVGLADEFFPGDATAWQTTEQGGIVRQRSRHSRQPVSVAEAVEDHVRRYEENAVGGFCPVRPERRQLVAA